MRSTFRPLSLSDFEISPEQGFLPQDPREQVADCAPLNELGHALPKLLSAHMVRPFIDRAAFSPPIHSLLLAGTGLSGSHADSLLRRSRLCLGIA